MKIKKYQITHEQWTTILQSRSKYLVRLDNNKVYTVDFQYRPEEISLEWDCWFRTLNSSAAMRAKRTRIIEVLDRNSHPEYWL